MMCVIYNMAYEFNNWKAFFRVAEFIEERHPSNFPTFHIYVPIDIDASTWDMWRRTVKALRKQAPEDLDEMTIYGKIWFEVSKDENLNCSIKITKERKI